MTVMSHPRSKLIADIIDFIILRHPNVKIDSGYMWTLYNNMIVRIQLDKNSF